MVFRRKAKRACRAAAGPSRHLAAEVLPMKTALFVAAAAIAATVAFSPAIAQAGNSHPQPIGQPLTITLPADKPYPSPINLRVDAPEDRSKVVQGKSVTSRVDLGDHLFIPN